MEQTNTYLEFFEPATSTTVVVIKYVLLIILALFYTSYGISDGLPVICTGIPIDGVSID
jgi:hypothetical protein